MPCYDNRNDRWTPDYEGDAKTYKAQAKLYKDRCDELARLLCMACQSLGAIQSGHTGNPELQSWWETHQAQDRVNAHTDRMREGQP